MEEKVIQEFKVIETDDGYRIEIKGDKEMLRGWLSGRRGRHFRRRGFGPFGMGFPGMMFMKGHHGPWDFDVEIEEDEEPDQAEA